MTAPRADAGEDASVGRLIADVTDDLQRLFRQELALARLEIKDEAVRTGKAGGMLGGAGFAAYMTVVLLSLALVFGLGELVGLGWAALIVAVLWGGAAAFLYSAGRRRMSEVSLKPEQTIETLKEDAQWAKHPTK